MDPFRKALHSVDEYKAVANYHPRRTFSCLRTLSSFHNLIFGMAHIGHNAIDESCVDSVYFYQWCQKRTNLGDEAW